MRKADLKYLHVSGYEVTQVLSDKIELVNIRLARPESLPLHQLHEDTTWKAEIKRSRRDGCFACQLRLTQWRLSLQTIRFSQFIDGFSHFFIGIIIYHIYFIAAKHTSRNSIFTIFEIKIIKCQMKMLSVMDSMNGIATKKSNFTHDKVLS